MKYVFIAVGGSGTKVAEALVNLLGVGFPTRTGAGGLTSEGDTLEIWRLDPDASSGAADSLQACVDAYTSMQEQLGGKWAMEVDPVIRHLDPLRLQQHGGVENQVRTLEGILNSGYGGRIKSDPFLRLFYESKDLEVKIDRGFYQKPFIGAPVMAVFSDTLTDETTHGGGQCRLNHHESLAVRFFLCGSLHGGTGACGVPIMGKFLKGRKRDKDLNKWRIGACLLAPYSLPPEPPFGPVRDGEPVTDSLVTERMRAYGSEKAFLGLTPEEQRELTKQILLGFYADPRDMPERTRQALLYYQDHAGDCFDELYLVSKPEPDQLLTWSNGGKSQSNPLNSAEVVAALSALNFFADPDADRKGYLVGTSTTTLDPHRMRLRDLPLYRVAGRPVDPERVILATAAMYHSVLHEIPWADETRRWGSYIALSSIYKNDDDRKRRDHAHYQAALGLLASFIAALVYPDRTLGWSEDDAAALGKFLSNNEAVYGALSEKMQKRGWRDIRAKEPLPLGNSSVSVSAYEFGAWRPDGEFTRGEYLRHVWQQLFTKDEDLEA